MDCDVYVVNRAQGIKHGVRPDTAQVLSVLEQWVVCEVRGEGGVTLRVQGSEPARCGARAAAIDILQRGGSGNSAKAGMLQRAGFNTRQQT